MKQKLKVAVLMGGVSAERLVSLKSGRAVARALRQAGHEVLPYDVKEQALPELKSIRPDVVFVALHGAWGEDGSVQKLLEKMALPYTGSGPKASRFGMNKLASKRLFIRHSVPTTDYLILPGSKNATAAAEQLELFGYPVICKPICSGSSLGVRIARSEEELPAALQAAREHSDAVLVERYVSGRELTVGILQGRALPVVEMRVAREFFDYRAKYEDAETDYITPVALLPTIYRKVHDAALRAYQALGCRHMARVDMIYGYDGRLAVLEVNTIPGLTPRSLLPMAAAEEGIELEDLCNRLVLAAFQEGQAGRLQKMTA
ncbi:MAG: D-alanine--D-alanine ligase [Planctomycetes bacterium]|nr:D-alanine--D-alanine ligase [Planctomycetota bacterium]